MLERLRQRFFANWRRGLAGAGVAIALGFMLWLPRLSTYSDQLTSLDKWSFDAFYGFQASTRIEEVRIIEMDEKSAGELNALDSAGLWDRERHAELLRMLTRDGAHVVVFDVFFAQPGNPEKDRALAEAMRAHDKVAIAAHSEPVRKNVLSGTQPVLPAESLRSAAASVGFPTIQRDTDGTVRRHFAETELQESLPWAVAALAGAAATTEGGAFNNAGSTTTATGTRRFCGWDSPMR